MSKRTYLQGEERRKINRSVWLSEDEAERLAKLATAVGKSNSELARLGVLQVLAKFESTGSVDLGNEVVELQPDLFGNIVVKTKQMEAGQPA